MKGWFSEGEPGFTIFSMEHLLCVFLILLVPFVMYIFRSYLRKTALIKQVLFWGLIVSEAFYHIWALYNDMWSVKIYLPLQLCSLNVWLSILLLKTENKKLFAFVYLFGFTGALQAVLTPELWQQAWSFRFIQFFLVHGLIIWTAMYFAIIEKYRITWSHFFFAFMMLNGFAVGTYIINICLKSNYMFLMNKPVNASLLDYLGPYPRYILSLEFVAFVLGLLVFIFIKDHSNKTIKTDRTRTIG
jgi:hypothetical integral membrane protein (TIGR02206 family)